MRHKRNEASRSCLLDGHYDWPGKSSLEYLIADGAANKKHFAPGESGKRRRSASAKREQAVPVRGQKMSD
jgi:hypothetical protein